MTEKENFVMIGDARDIPMGIGMLVMTWNACEIAMRDMLRPLASKGNLEAYSTSEVLISELGSVGLTQALNCYSHELPDDETALAEAIRHVCQVVDTCRAYRNYYVHNISGVTKYGLDFSYETMERDIPVYEAMTTGPFGRVYSKTAKGRKKFSLDFIDPKDLMDFNNYLANLEDYIQALNVAILHYLRPLPLEERAKPLPPLPLLSALKKPSFDHPKLKQRPALAPWTRIEDDEDASVNNEPDGG